MTDYKQHADDLYGVIVSRAREPVFYQKLAVPDRFDSRFEMIALHVFLVFFRLKEGNKEAETMAQALMDVVISDLDENLRQAGVGDLSVGKHVKTMARALLGRIAAYDAAVIRLPEDEAPLRAALERNIYASALKNEGISGQLAGYVQEQVEGLKAQSLEDIIAGRCRFGPVP